MEKHCVICGKPLTQTQQKFCSVNCKSKDFYLRHKNQSSLYQLVKYIDKKIKLIDIKGGKCEICGYDKNISALEFHHVNPNDKLFNIDGRNISNKSMDSLIEEVNKCKLLCSNCHKELHYNHYEKNNAIKILNENADLIKEKKWCKNTK